MPRDMPGNERIDRDPIGNIAFDKPGNPAIFSDQIRCWTPPLTWLCAQIGDCHGGTFGGEPAGGGATQSR